MKPRLLEVLCCPHCRASLALEVHERRSGEIERGMLCCSGCRARFPITRFVPRFVTTEQYARSFSLQRELVRRHFSDYVRDRSGEERLEPYTGFSREELSRGLTLEGGCGYGRFVSAIARAGGEVVGADLSTNSIDLAFDYVGRRPRVHLVQCDLFRMPFREGAFARVFSIGVLHHTPDPAASLSKLARFVVAGGQLSVWVYHPETSGRIVERWRRVTARMPPRLLYAFCVANQLLLSPLRRIPKVGGAVARFVPGYWPHPGTRFWPRVIGDFDTLSPRHASTHTPEEVTAWFEAIGFERVRLLAPLSGATGFAPIRSTSSSARMCFRRAA